MIEKVNFGGWPNCLRLCNSELELIVTTDVGPRIIRLGFLNKQNFFHVSSQDSGKIGGADWRIYGGHRLWHSPEVMPRTYFPDNGPVEYTFNSHTIILTQSMETTTGIVKEMEITLIPDKNEITVVHRLINQNLWDVELSPWGISALAPGGRAIIPHEPYGVGDDFLLPARPLVLWPCVHMQDPRWIWGNKYIQAKQDPFRESEQKIGVLNKQGWSAYHLNGELLIKRFGYIPGAQYPDYNSNNEIYIDNRLLEMESLGPMVKLAPHGKTEHTEYWLLTHINIDESEESIDAHLMPVVNSWQPYCP
jgi:hypothetical protein